MRTRVISFTLCSLLLAFCLPAHGQKIPRVGILRAGAPSASGAPDVLLQALRSLGYVEGKNILIDIRYAEGNRDRLRELAIELVQSKADAIYTGSSPAIFALKQATQTIPIVIVSSTDPVRSGIVASLAQPRRQYHGHVADRQRSMAQAVGVDQGNFAEGLTGRHFLEQEQHRHGIEAKATQEAAGPMGVALQDRGVKDPNEMESVLQAMSKERPDAFLALMDIPLRAHQKRILDFLAQNRVPAIFESKDWVEAGGLISYGPDSDDVTRRAAIQLDKILKGAKPADLPVEQPTKFELVINLKTAKQIGLVIPPNVLARADKVIR